MYSVSTMVPSPAGGLGRVRQQLMLLFAAVLMLGFFSPVATAQATAAPGALLVRDASVVEGDSSSVGVRIALERRVNHKVSVSFRTVEKSARSGVDFVAVSGRVVIPAGAKGRTVQVPVLDDALDEATEHFRLRIYDAAGASVVDRSGRVSIFDDDPAPTMSIGDVSVTEPSSGSSSMSFPVTLSAPSGRNISVSYVVTAGSATSGTDYVASPSSGQLVLPAGATSGFISVSVLADAVQEASETLNVILVSPVNATLLDSTAVGTIVDNTAPRLSVADVTVTEGDPARFVVSLNKPAPQTVTFKYSTSNGTASSSSDYTAVSNGSGTIAAGASSTTISINTTENTTPESNETFNLTVSQVVNAVVLDGTGVATIIDDDGKPDLSVNNASVTEGGNLTFTVSLSKTSTSPVTFNYGTIDGTAVAGSDYTSASNSKTIPAGATSTTITVVTTGDSTDEPNESLTLAISNVVNATVVDGEGLGTIIDDDNPPTLSVSDETQPENQDIVFHVTLSAKSAFDVKVNWATGDGTATSPADFTSASGTVTIPAGETSATFTVRVNNDNTSEGTETFVVNLSGPQNATIADGQGIGTIQDND